MAYYRLVPVLAFSIDPSVFWPYAAGAAILIIGLPVVLLGAVRRSRGVDRLIAFGPLLFAIPMAVFGADHFVTARFVARIVPAWMPWRLFWAYFVGVALIAGALSLATTIKWRLAAGSYALMFLIFELAMHIPNLIAAPHDKARFIIMVRDTPFLAGSLAFAASESREAATSNGRLSGLFSPLVRKRLIAVASVLMAIPIGIFGIEHFLNPSYAPGMPQDGPSVRIPMPNWLPAHVLWVYLTGSIFVLCAIAIIARRYVRAASILIGATFLVLIVLVYVPLTIARVGNVDGGLNYLSIHFAYAGAALMLASALPSSAVVSAGAPEMEPSGMDRVANL